MTTVTPPSVGPVLPPEPIARLAYAINARNPAQVADAFSPDYQCEVPLHPARSFTGNERARRNYVEIFARTPDLSATVLRWTRDGDTLWSEWEMRGTAPDGGIELIRGVVVAETDGVGPIRFIRFYLDTVDCEPIRDGS